MPSSSSKNAPSLNEDGPHDGDVFSEPIGATHRPRQPVARVGEDDLADSGANGGGDEGGDGHPNLQFLLDDEEAHQALLRENEEKERQVKNLKADPWRFVVAPIFVMLSISNAMQWIAFSPIVNEVRDYFHMSATQVNFLATTYVIAYVAIVFLSCKLYEVTGIKNGVLVSAAANATGSLIKIIALYAWPHAALLYLAQVFNSFTEVLTIATPPLISNRWFPENERMVANTIMSSALNFGCGVGVLIPTFFVTPEKQDKKHFAHFFWFHFALCFFMLGMVIFLFPRRPRYAASFAADRQQSKEEERMKALNDVMHRKKSRNDSNDNGGDEKAKEKDAHEDKRRQRPAAAPGDSNRHPDAHHSTAGSSAPKSEPVAAHTAAAASAEVEKGIAANASVSFLNDAPHEGDNTAALQKRKKGGKDVSGADAGEDAEVFDRESFNDLDTYSASDVEVEPVNVFSVLLDCLREARRNYSFVLLMLAAAAELGLIWAMATVLPQMLMPYGVSEAMSGRIGFLNLILGTVVCPFFMPLVERFGRRYKLILCTLAVILLVNMVLLTLLLHFGPQLRINADGTAEENNRYYVIVTFVCWGAVSGLCQNFMMPLMFEYVVELTFPMAESTSAPCLTWAACLTNLILALVFGEVLGDNPDENHSLRVFIGATAVTAVGAAALIFTKPMSKRRDYENRKKEEQLRLAQEIVELRFTIDNNNNNNASAVAAVGAGSGSQTQKLRSRLHRHGGGGGASGEFIDAGSQGSRRRRDDDKKE